MLSRLPPEGLHPRMRAPDVLAKTYPATTHTPAPETCTATVLVSAGRRLQTHGSWTVARKDGKSSFGRNV